MGDIFIKVKQERLIEINRRLQTMNYQVPISPKHFKGYNNNIIMVEKLKNFTIGQFMLFINNKDGRKYKFCTGHQLDDLSKEFNIKFKGI